MFRLSTTRAHQKAEKKRYIFNYKLGSEIQQSVSADVFSRANFHMYGYVMPTETGQMVHSLLKKFEFASTMEEASSLLKNQTVITVD
jgi:hypothetical protein